MGKLTLRSPVFNNMGEIPKKYTCQGEEINPPLTISGVSQEVKSLILIMEDPDAPIGTVTHWIICHLDPGTTKIPEACSLDGAIVGKNMMRKNKYMGPCPPKGKHRYFFKLYAVDEKLPLDSKSRKKKVLKAMKGHIIEQTELIGTYIKH